ncbi:hypothetical protein A2Z00_04875 [Candidatus Gottesmanbacteria bacterium RBG_13_45_10]|uniref:GlcNAc-PI de-N-acetylase n=1 Tax=Candidatus Gottesmanbacteria bacterium RBG_13_45_10 TaxID=1798370 RepID=A0A1F5ZGC4_9BACT|nr:MAG: hypothetical protein A2Z00_04875 [Candidatus Gottesmanbacteria bacterium RBG_13_45_10]
MKKLLLVFAHPDDESFSCAGTVAKYVKSGWDVDLVCATRGEVGITGPYGDISQEKLGAIRQKEAETAGTIIGISSITFLGYKDGTLLDLPPGELEDKIYPIMVERIPDSVITFDPTGISNHPDHIKMCYVTTFCFQKYAAWVAEKLAQMPSVDNDAEPKLYYACMPESVATYLKKKKNIPAESFGKAWVGTEDKHITTVINIEKSQVTKKKALKAHVSQSIDVDRFLSLRKHPLLRHEYFILRMHGRFEVFMGKHDRVSNAL